MLHFTVFFSFFNSPSAFFVHSLLLICDCCQSGKRLITFVMPLILGRGTYWIDKNSFSSLIISFTLFRAPALSSSLLPVCSVLYQGFVPQMEALDILESFREVMEVLTRAHNHLPAAVSLLFAFSFLVTKGWMSDDSAACLEKMWPIVFGRVDAFAGLCIALGGVRERGKKKFCRNWQCKNFRNC